jgi:hypothetical protein
MRTMSKTGAAMLAASFIVATAGVSAQAADPSADARFCANVAAADAHLSQLQAINPQTSVTDVRTQTGHVQADAKEMQKSDKMSTQAATTFDGAVNRLVQDVSGVRDTAALAKARAQIQSDAQGAQNAGRQLAAESRCSATQQP